MNAGWVCHAWVAALAFGAAARGEGEAPRKWAVLIAVSLAQAHFADLVLKRSLWLLASVTLATLISRFVFDATSGLRLLVMTLVTAALILLAPPLLRALDALITPPKLVVLRGTAGELAPWQRKLDREYEPHRLVFAIPNDADVPGLLAQRAPRKGPVAYVCEGMTCRAPLDLSDGVGLQ